MSLGADYYEVGRETSKVAARVLSGEDPKDIPIQNKVPEKLFVNVPLARELGIRLPESLLKRAANLEGQR